MNQFDLQGIRSKDQARRINEQGVRSKDQSMRINEFALDRGQVAAEREDEQYNKDQELENNRFMAGATSVLIDLYEKDPDQFYVASDELGKEGIKRGLLDPEKWDPQLVTIQEVQKLNNAAMTSLAGRPTNKELVGDDESKRIENYKFFAGLTDQEQQNFQEANAASKALKTVKIAMSDGRELTVNYDPADGSGFLLDGTPIIVAPGQSGGVQVMGQQGVLGEGEVVGGQPQMDGATLGISQNPAAAAAEKKTAGLEAERAFDSLKVSEQNLTMMENAFRLEPMMKAAVEGANAWNTGWGSMLSFLPASGAKDLESTITTVKANIGFDRLQRMRAESPTGGALGQVAVQELVALQSTIANLDTAQSTEQFKANMQIALQQYQSWQRKWGEAIMKEGNRDQKMRYYNMVPVGGLYMHPDGSWRRKGEQ